jgi:predicted Ser/Thr protein kinase
MERQINRKYIKSFDINLLDCELLGKGHNGVVYMLPDGNVIKICFDEDSCRKEYYILHKVGKNKYFPQAYGIMGNYMIRDYVDGIPLNKYIKRFGLDRELSLKLLDLLEEFRKLKFKKQDTRCKDIMVRPDGSLMIIDPKKFYSKKRNFPRHLSKGLYKLDVLDIFLETAKNERPLHYKKWGRKVQNFIREKQKELDAEKLRSSLKK